MTRPLLSTNLSSADFKQYYYLKNELKSFCRQNKLKTTGSKHELNLRISYFLETGKAKNESRARRPKKEYILDYKNLSLQSKIGPNYRTTRELRDYFKSIYGSKFHFSVVFQEYCRQNPDKTFAEAVEYAKKQKPASIAPQFEYNTYIRDFRADNKDKTFQEAIACWNYKKSQKGSNKYSREDLKALS